MWQRNIYILTFVFYSSQGFSNFIKKCIIDDNNCMIDAANEIVQNYSLGIAELGLQSLDPLKVEKLDITQGTSEAAVQMSLKLRQVEFLGLSKAKVYEVSGFKKDPERNKLGIKFTTPLGTLVGSYDIKGQFLILPITGNGNITLKLQNLDIQLKFLTSKVRKDDKTYMKIDKARLNYYYSGMNVNFSNLFNGDKELGDKMNNFLNVNWRLLDEVKRPIQIASAKVYKDILNSVFENVPYDEMFVRKYSLMMSIDILSSS